MTQKKKLLKIRSFRESWKRDLNSRPFITSEVLYRLSYSSLLSPTDDIILDKYKFVKRNF